MEGTKKAGNTDSTKNLADLPWPGLRYFFDRWFPRLHGDLTRAGVLSEPPEWKEINDYLCNRHTHIEEELSNKTYLPLAAKALSPNPLALALDRGPVASPIHPQIRQILGQSYGGDSASAQIAASSRQSRVVRNILKHLDRAQNPLILLGEPGSGKTMTMQQSMLLLAEREREQVFPKIPIYVRLGAFYVEGKVSKEDVWAYVKRSADSSIQRYIDELERNGRLVIFFDGMDEMSRERYGEHTEALSVFARDSNFKSKTKTLFSCRITDFSPKFQHQQLVILPFDRNQVDEYLRKYRNYIGQFPLMIDDRPWSLKQLTNKIVQGELPIEANNPFVLWLLCLYLRDKQAWPQSRVEMLAYYNKWNYDRKINDLVTDRFKAFAAWARFAYLTTERNRGPAMPVNLLQENQDATMVGEMIRVGKHCGVLVESLEQCADHRVWFQHHRFQEYFTALYIHQNRPDIHWLEKFDAPRWQETMLNLILLGGAEDIVQTFAESVILLTQACQTEITHSNEQAQKNSQQEFILSGETQTVLADRVEVTSRILHQLGKGMPQVRKTLMTPFREAIGVLSNHGNPITQVKMMRACQNVQEIDFIEALQKPLNSSVNWVRNQALLLIAGSKASSRAIGTDMATEIGYDLANGHFPSRLPAYWKGVCVSRDLGNIGSLLAGMGCYIAYVLLLLASAGLLYWGMCLLGDTSDISKSGLHGLSILHHRYSIAAFGVSLFIAAIATWIISPSWLWAVVLGGSMGLGIVIPILSALWAGSWKELPILFIFFIYVIYNSYIIILIAFPIHYSILSLYSVLTYRLRKSRGTYKTIMIAAWKGFHFNWLFLNINLLLFVGFAFFYIMESLIMHMFPDSFHSDEEAFICISVVLVVVCIFLLVIVQVCPYMFRLCHSFVIEVGWLRSLYIFTLLYLIIEYLLDYSLLIELTYFLCLSFITLFIYDLYKKEKVVSFIKYAVKHMTLFLIFIVCCVILTFGMDYISYFFNHISPAAQIQLTLVTRFLTILGLIILLLFIYRLASEYSPNILGKKSLEPSSITVEDWKQKIKNAKANKQKHLLSQTNYQTLSINENQFLAILKEIQPFINEEPALSVYWEKRDQQEEALRQERQG